MGIQIRTVCLLVVAFSLVGSACLSAAPPASEEPCQAPEELGVCENAKGTVYFYDDRQLEAWVTIGSSSGLRPTARVAFLRNGEVVAEGDVVQVRNCDAVVRPDKDTPAGTILRGDDVRVTRNGTEEALKRQISGERTIKALGSLLITSLLVYCIAL